MLLGLSIRDVVLIDRLDIGFRPGLSVLTGETGAGKSILLDSLGLALGARSESGLVRRGAEQLSVAAEFSVPSDHPAVQILAEQSLDAAGELVLRRVVSADGRSRAFVNDQPISVGLLRRIGDSLVEIHGQFESHGLLDAGTHRGVLDAFAETDVTAVRQAWSAWQETIRIRRDAEASLAKARGEEDFLRHAVEELNALAPKSGEEASLAERRAVMMHGEKLLEGMNAAQQALSQKGDVEGSIRAAQRALERVAERAEGRLDPVIAALDRAALEASEAQNLLEKVSQTIDLDPTALEKIEERLFSLRAIARKHGVAVDDLAALANRLSGELRAIDAGGDGLARLAEAERKAKQTYHERAKALSAQRTSAARRLDAAVAVELPPLKLDKATFRTRVDPLEEDAWGETGLDRIAFEVATNPGIAPGPLAKIASGGELSRFMLALKVVLARTTSAPTIVFDEVDSGIGGAVAAAVGERLARLAADVQVLVVTHSPQVAAKGAHHWHVAKGSDGGDSTVTRVQALSGDERREEIARMLAGAQVTDQARAAAESLLATPGA
ncbi:DNA repair protein RecN [Telmatospirillum siberiense]|uniref:DNA repair protein RecN n=1 Tax=Telmatospirillum siberiense TaxID=382514 RepID=A0A2N3PQM4_9PROT|nr:DNA repair protein RecN [Telmatospirillum siberiense]PKU22697.1 DNA repair protein RecN [Telmatospirillum siberiense]